MAIESSGGRGGSINTPEICWGGDDEPTTSLDLHGMWYRESQRWNEGSDNLNNPFFKGRTVNGKHQPISGIDIQGEGFEYSFTRDKFISTGIMSQQLRVVIHEPNGQLPTYIGIPTSHLRKLTPIYQKD